jgi:hypothetical protein
VPGRAGAPDRSVGRDKVRRGAEGGNRIGSAFGLDTPIRVVIASGAKQSMHAAGLDRLVAPLLAMTNNSGLSRIVAAA